MIEAVLFDLDETIILDEAISHQAFGAAAALAAAHRPRVNASRLADTASNAARQLWQESPFIAYTTRIGHSAWEGLWAENNVGDHPAISGLRAWAPGYRVACWRTALQEQGVDAPELAEACAAAFITARRQYPCYPEIDALLAVLAPRYKLGIVTNGVPDLQRRKLAGCGVAQRFQATVVSGEIDCGKPDPGIFHHICAELGVRPEACVMVGDNPERDIAGAIAAGMRSVWVQRNGRAPDPRYPASLTCTDLSAMLPWLSN